MELSVLVHLLQLLSFPLEIPNDAQNASALIETLTAKLAEKNKKYDFHVNPNPLFSSEPEQYDFIVVGSGTAGSIVANRLSANEKYKVLLLEAGGDPTLLNSIPALVLFNMHQKDTDWNYKTISTKEYGKGMPNNMARWTRFKGLGGCSSHNWMIYNRGHPKDFDNWASILDDETWNYEHLLQYFKRLEDYEGRYPSDVYHGKGGPFHVTKDDGHVPSVQPFIQAAKEMGYKTDMDFNARQDLSFGRSDIKTTKYGKRMSTYEGYIRPILERPNFKVIRYAHVQKVILNDKNEAIGVIYKRNGELIKVLAKREIILSAGSINSPQLLMLSGIGNKEHLQSVGVETLVHLPGVGEHLEDHPLAFVGPFLLDSKISYIPSRDLTKEDAEEYAKYGTGAFATNPVGGLGYIATSVAHDQEWSDVQPFQFHYGIDETTPFMINQVFNQREGLIEKFLEPYMGYDANWGVTNIGLPRSTGTIKLASKDPEDKPIIDPNYYDNPNDMVQQVEGIKFLVQLFENTEVWKKHNARLAPTPYPGCEQVTFKSDEYWECLARQVTTTLFHPTGTCKMGKSDDEMAVVDSRLRVRKVKGLRVADASVMPRITNANTNTPTLMIGEKAADMILADHINSDYERDEL